MRINVACTGLATLAAAMLAAKPAEGSCEDPSDPAPLAVTSLGASVLRPVGPHPRVEHVLATAAGNLQLLDLGELTKLTDISSINSVGTAIPIELTGGDQAAFVAYENADVRRIDIPEAQQMVQRWITSVGRAGEGDGIATTPAIHLARLATESFKLAFGGADLVYVTTRYDSRTANRIWALDAQNGSPVWIFNLGELEDMDVALADPFLDIENNILYVATDRTGPSGQHSLWAIDVLTGAKLWSADHGRLWTNPVVRGDRLYVVTLSGEMKAIDVADGSLIWSLPHPEGLPVTFEIFAEFRSPYAGYIAAVDFDGQVWMVKDEGDDATGQWLASPGAAEASSRVAMDPQNGKLYVGAKDGRIYQLNLDDGATEASRQVSDTDDATVGVPTLVFNDPAVFDTLRLIAGAETGQVAKFCIPWAVEAP